MTFVPQPTPQQWSELAMGSESHPKLHDFRATEQRASQIQELKTAQLSALKAGKGPAAYEELHRQYAGWKCYTYQAIGTPEKFIRIKNTTDVRLLVKLTITLLNLEAEPFEYFKLLVQSMEFMREFKISRMNVRYITSDGLIADMGAKLASRRKGIEKVRPADRLHSFSAPKQNSGALQDSDSYRARKALELAGMTVDDATLVQVLQAVKLIKSGSPSFIAKKTRELASVVIEGTKQ